MFHLEKLEFPRSLVPRNYDENVKPTLVLFSDGSDLAQSVVSYLVWVMGNGSHHISLVTSRAKIASMTKISTPKSELCAAQMSSRLRVWLQSEMDIEAGEVFHFVDASIIIGMWKNISLKFDTYTAPRITEIQMNTEVHDWFWVDTTENPADLSTRGKWNRQYTDGSCENHYHCRIHSLGCPRRNRSRRCRHVRGAAMCG